MLSRIRIAARTLTRRPIVAGVITLTLMLGIGATTATFSVVNGVLIEPLPYPDADRLVMVWEHNLPRERETNVASPANFLSWRESASRLEGMAALVQIGATLTGDGTPERVGLVLASPSFFTTVGARPEIGRLFAGTEGVVGAEDVAVLSWDFWQRMFGGDPGVLGRTITMNGGPLTVIGVLERGFSFPLEYSFGWSGPQEVWAPQVFGDDARNAVGRYLQVVARLADGSTLGGAREEMSTIAARLRGEYPDRQAGWDVNVVPLRAQQVGEVERGLLLVLAAVGLVLLIACANVANLMLAWSAGRRRELAVRASLGATRGRIFEQLLTESALLALAGGLAGLGLAWWGLEALLAVGPDLPRMDAITLDGRVLAFAATLTLGAALLFGLLPVLGAGPLQAENLKAGDDRSGVGPGVRRMRHGLVVAEIAFSLVLIVGAGLLIRSFGNLMDTGIGMDVDRLLTAQVELSDDYPEAEDRARFFDAVTARMSGLPGVESATAITFAPLGGIGSATSFWPGDRPVPERGTAPVADVRTVEASYHRVAGIPRLAGRTFEPSDDAGAPPRAVVSRALVQAAWPGIEPAEAVGRSVVLSWGENVEAEVVGVVEDVRHDGPMVEPRPKIYYHHRQFQPFDFMTVLVRAESDPTAYATALREAVADLDPMIPVYDIATMEDRLSAATARTRFAMFSLGAFAAAALILAIVGVYGVLTYAVGRRTREFGIRISLGAPPAAVAGMVLREGATLIALAIALGIAAALSGARLLEGLVFEVRGADPLTLVASALLLTAAALTAAYVPARRAARVDPAQTLREE